MSEQQTHRELVKIELYLEDGETLVTRGLIDVEKIADAQMVEYFGMKFVFTPTSKVRTAKFVKCKGFTLLFDYDFE